MSITYRIENCNEGIENFADYVEEVFKTVLECEKLILIECLEDLDQKLMRERDSKRYRNKGSRKTAVKTKLGTIEYNPVGYILIQLKTSIFSFLMKQFHRNL